MNYLSKTLLHSFVKPFYKENAGAFVFMFTMMFCIVSKVDGAGLYAYHYSLVTGMLKSNIFLLLVLLVWFIYTRKFVVFVSDTIRDPHYTFLQLYNQLNKGKRIRLFFIVEIMLLMPVLLYTLFICFVGLKQHLYLPVFLVISYLLLLCISSAAWHVYQLNNLDKTLQFSLKKITAKFIFFPSYSGVLLRFVISKQLTIYVGIKIFTCAVLYLTARNNSITNYDISMPFLFYNFGILANGVLIFRIRTFEEMYLSFYKGMPVSLIKRFLQYAFIYCLLLIPEYVTIVSLAPVHLYFTDAVNFILCGFGLLLLMNSITFSDDFKMKEYVTILLAVFAVECIFLMAVGFVFLYLLLFILAVIFFLKKYYTFQQNV